MILYIKECVSDGGALFEHRVEAAGGYHVLERLGYKTEQARIAEARRAANAAKLVELAANAPTIEKLCERPGCGVVFHPSIHRRKPKYCGRPCFINRRTTKG